LLLPLIFSVPASSGIVVPRTLRTGGIKYRATGARNPAWQEPADFRR